jgi:hypothetical protein
LLHTGGAKVQNILAGRQRAGQANRGADAALADAWIGHMLIDPTKGKVSIGDATCTESSLSGATLRATVPDTDFGKPGRRTVEPNATSGHVQHDTVHALYAGTATHDDWKMMMQSKRHFSAIPRRRPPGATVRRDLTDMLQAHDVSATEAARNRHRWAEDSASVGRRALPVPGANHPSAGAPSPWLR